MSYLSIIALQMPLLLFVRFSFWEPGKVFQSAVAKIIQRVPFGNHPVAIFVLSCVLIIAFVVSLFRFVCAILHCFLKDEVYVYSDYRWLFFFIIIVPLLPFVYLVSRPVIFFVKTWQFWVAVGLLALSLVVAWWLLVSIKKVWAAAESIKKDVDFSLGDVFIQKDVPLSLQDKEEGSNA